MVSGSRALHEVRQGPWQRGEREEKGWQTVSLASSLAGSQKEASIFGQCPEWPWGTLTLTSDPNLYSGAFGFDFCVYLEMGSYVAQVGLEFPM